ncbi:MAG: hypothetical protein HUJ25_05695 [Crocinitomicaceae bacterium]|nr:hypothetical protein [Crocinitomicaceae bacterium]
MSKKSRDIVNFIIIVVAILLIIITVGILYSEYKKKDEIEEPEIDPLADLEKELEEVNSQINELEPQREKLEGREKKFFLGARILVGLMFICGNIFYLCYYDWKFNLGNQLNINSAALLLYGFTAYILYGSIGKFTESIKSSVINYLRRKHIHIWEELKRLKRRRVELIQKINDLKNDKK